MGASVVRIQLSLNEPVLLILLIHIELRSRGRLTSEGEGLGGATITFTWSMGNPGAKILSPTQTNSDGFYGVAGSIPSPIDNVIAHYAGDSEHMPAQSEAFLKYPTPPNH